MRTAITCFIALDTPGCLALDDSMFNPSTLASYNLSTAVIPDTSREFVTLESQGKRIYGYFVRSNGDHPSWTVLYCHGNRDHLQYYWNRVELLYRMGFNVFVFDYQGFGMSEGTPSEEGLYADGLAALTYVRRRPDVRDSLIAFFGFSLGNAVSIHLAANAFTPRGLVAEAPFASASTLVQSGTLLDIPGSYVMRGDYNNAEKIKRVAAPLLVIHGENDKFIDIDKNGAVVFRNAMNPKRFVRVAGADHSEVPAKLGEQAYIDLVRGFVLTGD